MLRVLVPFQLITVTTLLPCQVHFIVAACENMIDGNGMLPSDVLTASNGKTVEASISNAYLSSSRSFLEWGLTRAPVQDARRL